MSCYSNSANGSQTKDGSIATEKKWEANGTLTEELISLFKSEAQKNSLDWRWLAALSYVESNWRTNIRNSYGYYGLFQFIDSTLNDGVKAGQRRYSLTSPKDQTEVAARNMARRLSTPSSIRSLRDSASSARRWPAATISCSRPRLQKATGSTRSLTP